MDPSFGHDGDCHNDYHLQFVKDNCDAEFPNEINVALKWMFAGPPPLTYLAHQVQQSDGEPIVVLVILLTAFQLFEISAKSTTSRSSSNCLRQDIRTTPLSKMRARSSANAFSGETFDDYCPLSPPNQFWASRLFRGHGGYGSLRPSLLQA